MTTPKSNQPGFRRDAEMIKKKAAFVSTNENTAAMVAEGRRWDALNPELLALFFLRIPVEEMVRSVPFVCKAWMEVVAGPYCWSDVDLQAWCRRRNDSHAVDLVVKKLVRRSKCTVRRLSAYRMGETGFFSVAYCGNFLKVLEMPMSGINDQMVLKHIKPLPNLAVLDISHCLQITSKSLAAFGNQCKSLVHLKRNMPPLESCLLVDDSEAKTVANTMPNLQRIELCFGRFGDPGLSEILTKCKSLAHLDIQGCGNVKLGGVLEEMCEKLQYFNNPWIDYDEFSDTSEGSDVDFTESESD